MRISSSIESQKTVVKSERATPPDPKEKKERVAPTPLTKSEVREKLAKLEEAKAAAKGMGPADAKVSAEDTKGKLKELLNSGFNFSDKERETMQKMLKQ